MMGAVPQEAGSVLPLASGSILGMPFMIDAGLPFARNNMEVASIFDASQGGGVFFCDLDGDLDNGIPPLQFNLSAKEVVAFWTGTISPNTTAQLPRLGIGVHATGDWHQAVDFYTSIHRPRWSFENTPSWFRDAAAIYCPAGSHRAALGRGLNADLGFGNLPRLRASPVRYGIPEVCMFGNGVGLNGLHQFYVAGHGLALCSLFPGSFMFD